jgi:hypothetical protein
MLEWGKKPRSRLTSAQRARVAALSETLGRLDADFATHDLAVASFCREPTPEKEILFWEMVVESVAVTVHWHACGRPRRAAPLLGADAAAVPLQRPVLRAWAAAPTPLLRRVRWLAFTAANNGDLSVLARAALEDPAETEVLRLAHNAAMQRRTALRDAAHTLSQAAPLLMRSCAQCGHESHIHRSCALCRQAWYCDAECQRAHWRASHKRACARRTDAGPATDARQSPGIFVQARFN